MAKKRQSATRGVEKKTVARRRRLKELPLKAGTTVVFIDPKVAVLLSKRQGGGGAGGLGATIRICKCVKTEFRCSKAESGLMICREECASWECEDIETEIQ